MTNNETYHIKTHKEFLNFFKYNTEIYFVLDVTKTPKLLQCYIPLFMEWPSLKEGVMPCKEFFFLPTMETSDSSFLIAEIPA